MQQSSLNFGSTYSRDDYGDAFSMLVVVQWIYDFHLHPSDVTSSDSDSKSQISVVKIIWLVSRFESLI